MRQPILGILFLASCATGVEDPAPVPTIRVEVPEPSKSEPSPNEYNSYDPCGRSSTVVIRGEKYLMPVECNPDYFYIGDPPPFMTPILLLLPNLQRPHSSP